MNRIPKGFIAHPYAYHHELELLISDITNLGVGIGRDQGWVIQVPFCWPGEKVKVRIFRNHNNYSQADLVEVLTPSNDRIEPVCKLHGICGGCQYQGARYDAQLLWKHQQVENSLVRLGKGDGASQPGNSFTQTFWISVQTHTSLSGWTTGRRPKHWIFKEWFKKSIGRCHPLSDRNRCN